MTASAMNQFIQRNFGNYFGFLVVCFMLYGLLYSLAKHIQDRIPWLRRNNPNNENDATVEVILTEEELAMRRQQRRAAAKDGLAYRAGIPDISNRTDRLLIFEYFFQPRSMHPTKCCHLSHIIVNSNQQQQQNEKENHGISLIDQEEGTTKTCAVSTPTPPVEDSDSSLFTRIMVRAKSAVSVSSNVGEVNSNRNGDGEDDDAGKPVATSKTTSTNGCSEILEGNQEDKNNSNTKDDDDDDEYAENACPICFNDYFQDGPGEDQEKEENTVDSDDGDNDHQEQQQPQQTTTSMMVMTGTNCNHVFHYNCFKQWVEMGNDHCPYCRKDMMTVGEFLDAARTVLGDERIDKLLQQRTLSSINEQQQQMQLQQQRQQQRSPTASS